MGFIFTNIGYIFVFENFDFQILLFYQPVTAIPDTVEILKLNNVNPDEKKFKSYLFQEGQVHQTNSK